MKVYLDGYRAQHQASYFMHLNPAAHIGAKEMPDWVDGSNNPKPFQIEFKFGAAEVPDHLAKYMIEHKIALKTKPPAAAPWPPIA